jgi:hypothetical protein
MSKKTSSGANAESQLLALLKQVLPKATHDPKLASQIYKAIEQELRIKQRAVAFEKFCARCELPDLEPKSVAAVQRQLAASFGEGDVTIKPNRKEGTLAVEVALPDGTQFTSQIQVKPAGSAEAEGGEDGEFKPKFAPFPVGLAGDKELVWLLAKAETMSPEEAGIALNKLEDDFWASKAGQKLLRDRVERCFPEFIGRVPAGLLSEVGLKRHYKTPEPVKILRTRPAK